MLFLRIYPDRLLKVWWTRTTPYDIITAGKVVAPVRGCNTKSELYFDPQSMQFKTIGILKGCKNGLQIKRVKYTEQIFLGEISKQD